MTITFDIPKAYRALKNPARYKILEGGRGAGRSHTVARMFLLFAMEAKRRFLCLREIQKSIADSVHKLISDLIKQYGLESIFDVTKNNIVCTRTGSEFIFCGLHQNEAEIKSKEGIDFAWVEEAEKVKAQSWDYLIPTIRKEGSEIWMTFNPDSEEDPTYKRFVKNRPPGSMHLHTTFRDNPYFTGVLRREMEWCKQTDIDAYNWIWEGLPRKLSAALVFRGKFVEEEFETPHDAQFYHGVDWGFSNDPTVIVRCFVKDAELFIDQEAWGVGVELDDLPALFNTVDTAPRWRIYADNSRPETISHILNRGFDITACDKWNGSVEDGIAKIKSFSRVIVHPRCRRTLEEFKLYSYKKDKLTGEPLPVIEDKNNHCMDALRYALNDVIKQRASIGVEYL